MSTWSRILQNSFWIVVMLLGCAISAHTFAAGVIRGGDPNLGGTNLGGTNLGGTNLGGTNLGGTNLGGTNLGGTNLGGTNLGGTNLGGTNLGGSQGNKTDDKPETAQAARELEEYMQNMPDDLQILRKIHGSGTP